MHASTFEINLHIVYFMDYYEKQFHQLKIYWPSINHVRLCRNRALFLDYRTATATALLDKRFYAFIFMRSF